MFKKILILVCFSTLINSLNGQSNFTYKINIEPIISSCHLHAKNDSIDNSLPSDDYISKRQGLDNPKIGIKIDFGAIYSLSKRLNVYTGLFFLNQKVGQSKFFPVSKIRDPFNDGGFIFTYDVKDYNATYNYFGLPIGARYDLFQTTKLSLGLDCSFNITYLISTSNSDKTLNKDFPSTDNKNYVLGGNFGVYTTIMISDKYLLEIKPDFGYSLTPNLIELSAIKQNNYFLGLSIGLIKK